MPEQAPRKATLPAPEGGSFAPFFKAEHLGKAGVGKVKVLEVRDANPNSFSDIIVAIKLDGESYDWGMKFSSGNYRRLVTRFGTNPDKWQGTVNVKVAEYAGKQYVAVDD